VVVVMMVHHGVCARCADMRDMNHPFLHSNFGRLLWQEVGDLGMAIGARGQIGIFQGGDP
jgi:hypothetical protein